MIPDGLNPVSFQTAQAERLATTIETWPWKSFRSSGMGHPCDRYITWSFTRWKEAAPHGFVLESIFQLGRALQPIAEQRLVDMGFRFHREPYKAEQYRIGKATISAKPDVLITGYQGAHYNPPIVGDIKGVQAWAWGHYHDIHDFWAADNWIVRGYATQVNLQMLLMDLPVGVLFLFSKGHGLIKPVPFELDYAAAEAVLQRVERLQGEVEAQRDPPPIEYDDGICGRCGFLALCYPPRDMGAGAVVVQDEQLIEDLGRRAILKETASEYSALQKSVNARLKQFGDFEMLLAGEWVVVRKEVTVKGYSVPPRIDTRFEIRSLQPKQQIASEDG